MVTIDIKLYREKLIKNAEEMISSAKLSFEKQNFPVAAFLSITAIEEISRIWYSLRFIHFMSKHDPRKEDRESLIQMLESMKKEKTWQALSAKAKEAKKKILDIIGPYTIVDLDAKELRKMVSSKPSKNHVIKQQIGLLSSLVINTYAYRKLGPAMIEKYINMAKTGKLFELRNRCLYVDVVGDSLLAPSEIILETEALELVCLAMEVFAELSDFGAAFLDDSYGKEATDKWVSIRKGTNKFEEKHPLVPKKKLEK